MQALSRHYEDACRRHPEKRLMLLSDIDGTILDMRHMILMVLQAYDRVHGTRYFERLQLTEIHVHEYQVDRLLSELNVPAEETSKIQAWYLKMRWAPQAIREMHRPYRGALDIIRWFQLQPNTYVGLVTGRPENSELIP